MKIVITGPQGSGKTTQAEILAKKLGLCFIGTGDLLRDLAEKKSQLGEKIEETLNSGELADDRIVTGLVRGKIESSICSKGFVTDGYPRTFSQHQLYDPGFDKVFYLKISDGEAERRLLKRGREDDTSALIKERLSWYHEQTQPLLDYYQKQGKLVTINGESSIEKVSQEIMDRLGDFGS